MSLKWNLKSIATLCEQTVLYENCTLFYFKKFSIHVIFDHLCTQLSSMQN